MPRRIYLSRLFAAGSEDFFQGQYPVIYLAESAKAPKGDRAAPGGGKAIDFHAGIARIVTPEAVDAPEALAGGRF
jgi:hypothetical protein